MEETFPHFVKDKNLQIEETQKWPELWTCTTSQAMESGLAR
jgi:hypothetical protein